MKELKDHNKQALTHDSGRVGLQLMMLTLGPCLGVPKQGCSPPKPPELWFQWDDARFLDLAAFAFLRTIVSFSD